MLRVLTAAEMREADRRTIEEVGLPGAVLMENAGAGVAALIRKGYPAAQRLAVLSGMGNNGGDGFVAARRLLDRQPEVTLFGRAEDVRGDAALHLAAFTRSGGRVHEVLDEESWIARRASILSADLIVDALLGTGLSRQPEGLVGSVVRSLSGLRGTPVVAVDLPSGVSSDTGDVPWDTVRAELTVTFAALKYGHVLAPACERVGEAEVVDIGIPRALLEEAGARLFQLESSDAARAFPRRRPGAHKGDHGHLLVVAGSVGKSGAAVLAGRAGLLGGAGLVTVATPEPALPLVAAGRAEMMTEPLSVAGDGGLDRQAVDRCLALAGRCSAVALGPGLGQQDSTREFVRDFVRSCPTPLVVDADGLNGLGPVAGGDTSLLSERAAATILTPHPGEMARLLAIKTHEVQARRLEVARELAQRSGAVVLLKGQRSLVVEPGGRAAVNPTGNPGMASGGTGDVLTGLVGALLAGGREPWLAATAGAFLHGLAGDLARDEKGPESLLAGDVLVQLPYGIRQLSGDDAG